MAGIKAAAGPGAAAAAVGREAGACLLCRGMVHFSSLWQPLGQDKRLVPCWDCAREDTMSYRAPKITLSLTSPRSGFEILRSAM